MKIIFQFLSIFYSKLLKVLVFDICRPLIWACPIDNLYGLPGLQETGSERSRHPPSRLLFQPWGVCGRYGRMEETEDHQTAGEMDGGEFQVRTMASSFWKTTSCTLREAQGLRSVYFSRVNRLRITLNTSKIAFWGHVLYKNNGVIDNNMKTKQQNICKFQFLIAESYFKIGACVICPLVP